MKMFYKAFVVTESTPDRMAERVTEAIEKIENAGYSYEIHYSTAVQSAEIHRFEHEPGMGIWHEKEYKPVDWVIEYSVLILTFKEE